MLRLDETFYNPVKHMLKDKKKVLGAWLQMASPYAAEIFAKSGLDVVMVDMEHGPNDILSLIDQLRAIGHFNAVPFVRAPWNDMVIIKRILDAGAYGILVPYVNTPEEAAAAVSYCKYPTSTHSHSHGASRPVPCRCRSGHSSRRRGTHSQQWDKGKNNRPCEWHRHRNG